MKNILLITATAGFLTVLVNSNAQGLYFGAGGGYGLPAAVKSFNNYGKDGSYSYYNNNSTAQYSSTTTNTSKSFSLGSGAGFGIYGGYMVINNIGFELGIGDKLSSTTSSTFTSNYNYTGTSTSSLNITNAYTLTGGSLFSITPAIRLMAGGAQIHPYMVTGMIVGFPPSTTFEDLTTTASTGGGVTKTATQDEIYTYSGNIMLGFHGAVGVLYMVNDKIGVSGEIFGNFMNWAPGKKVLTTLTYNGADSLTNTYMTNHGLNKETDYGSSAASSTSSSAPAPSPATPQQSTYIYMPCSSFGIKISVFIALGGSK